MKRITGIVAGILLFLASLFLTLYPLISDYVNTKYQSQVHTAYEEAISEADNSVLIQARVDAEKYNQALSSGLVDAFSQAALHNAAAEYHNLLNVNNDSIMGYVNIPKINVQLPIFHGTESEVLDRGVGHVLGSSLPVGGSSTHTVLSAHSGMASQRMFTDLEQLEIGDVLYLTVLGETLAYQVDTINTVLPHETELLQITKDVDGCTLVTCTPYGVNTHRLLVHGVRIPYEEAESIIEETIQAVAESTWQRQYIRGLIVGLVCALEITLEFFFAWLIWRRRNE